MTCPSGIETSCPEVTPVTLNQTIIQIDDSPMLYKTETFVYGDAVDHRSFQLATFPYEPRSVDVVLNSGVQIYGTDFVVNGQYVVMSQALGTTDKIYVRYTHVSGALIPSQIGGVGTIIASAGAVLDGFLLMDGTTTYAWADYAALYDWFHDVTSGTARRAALLTSYDGTNFVLKLLQDTSYDGTTLVTLSKFIRTG